MVGESAKNYVERGHKWFLESRICGKSLGVCQRRLVPDVEDFVVEDFVVGVSLGS